jgi:roadblock/LC7 domain-containing protein
MATLDELMKLPGAMAAFEFRGSGELLEQRIAYPERINESTIDLLAHMCAANMSIATMQARGWEKVTHMKGFYPIQEFTLLGFDWSVVVSGLNRERLKDRAGKTSLPPFTGVVLANEKADYEAAFATMEKPESAP